MKGEYMSNKKLDLIAVKTDDGKYYIADRSVMKDSYYNGATLINYLFDSKKPFLTFEKNWIYVDSKPEKITFMVPQLHINYRYELLDKSLISDKFKEFVKIDDFDYRHESLYKKIWDIPPDKEQEFDFEIEVIVTTNKILDPVKMSYKVEKGIIDEKCIKYQLADKIIFPSICLTKRPCSFSSQDTYKIVREYIKDNIDPSVAVITSDYSFCFTVQKRIKLAEIEKYTIDVNNSTLASMLGRRKRKPKYVKKQQIEKQQECFAMTYSPYNYTGYLPIKGFVANSQQELKDKIDNYCKSVVDFINKPFVECKHCNGYGIINCKDIYKINERYV